MKVAVSIPELVFKAAEKEAKRRRIPRSQLYAEALRQLLAAERDRKITESYNRVYAKGDPGLDPVLAQMQWESLHLEQDEW